MLTEQVPGRTQKGELALEMLWKLYHLLILASKVLSRKGIYPFLAAQLSRIETGAKVLAVGAGGRTAETIREYAKRQRFDLDLFDISTEHKSPDIVGDICTYEFERPAMYRYVFMSEVLEHLHSPQDAIDRVHRVLKPDGRLILTAPFIFPIHDRPHDYYRFTKYGLTFLLRAFRDVTVAERNSWAEALNVLLARLVMERRWRAQLAAPFAVMGAFLLTPVALGVAKLIPTDFLTTGYIVVAIK